MTQIDGYLVGFYAYRLVALSIFIAISASYMALDLGGRVTAARGWIRFGWLIGGATAMGLGIWSMHFTGMLAFHLPVPVFYDWPTVLLSLLAAIFASAVALYVVSRRKMGSAQAWGGSVLMGLGIAGMHYSGMAAMRLSAMCLYDPAIVTVSIIIAIVAAQAALVFTFGHRENFRGTTLAKVISATVMGAAIFLMHYTGMLAAKFIPSTGLQDMSHVVSITSLGSSGIAFGILVVQGLTILTSSMDRRFAHQTQETNERFHQIAENLPFVLVLANADFSEILYVNQAYQQIWDRTLESFYAEPMSFLQGIHLEDRGRVAERVQRLIRGELIDNLECRVVRPDGSIYWIACRGYPIRDAQGRVYRLVGSARDITQRKATEEELRRISVQLLRLQDEERRRIARELHDSTGQDLVALATMIGQLSSATPSDWQESRALFSECQELVDHCIREVRTFSYVLHPQVLDEAGLEEAIFDYAEGFTRRSGIKMDLELSPRLGRMSQDIELAVFRVVQESLSNILRHSGSQHAKIRIDRDSNLTLEVSDDGHGVFCKGRRDKEGALFEVGVGIPSMRERIKLVGGQLDMDSSSKGTTVRVTIPLLGGQA